MRSRSLFWVEQQHSCPKFHKPRTSTAGLLAPYTGNLHWWRDCIRDDLHHGSRCQRISLQIDDVDTWPPAICEMFRLKYVEMFIIFSNIHQNFFQHSPAIRQISLNDFSGSSLTQFRLYLYGGLGWWFGSLGNQSYVQNRFEKCFFVLYLFYFLFNLI